MRRTVNAPSKSHSKPRTRREARTMSVPTAAAQEARRLLCEAASVALEDSVEGAAGVGYSICLCLLEDRDRGTPAYAFSDLSLELTRLALDMMQRPGRPSARLAVASRALCTAGLALHARLDTPSDEGAVADG